MPAEVPAFPGVDVIGHGPCPIGPGDTSQPAHHGVHDVRESIAPLQCITAVARGPRYRCQLAACLAMDRGQVVRVSWHLRRLRQPASNLFSLFNVHLCRPIFSTTNFLHRSRHSLRSRSTVESSLVSLNILKYNFFISIKLFIFLPFYLDGARTFKGCVTSRPRLLFKQSHNIPYSCPRVKYFIFFFSLTCALRPVGPTLPTPAGL
jgi:hypothetical protein